MSSEQSQRQGMAPATKFIIGAICLAAAIALLAWLFRGSTTIKQERTENAKATSLHCSASGVDNGVFDTYGAISAEYTIDAIFYDNKIDNLTYTYEGTYTDTGTADTARGNIMSAFNIRLGELGLQENHFGSKSASLDDTVFRYRVYAEKDDITVDAASMLMIDVDRGSTSQHVPTSYDELKTNYQNHGFVCKTGA